MKIYQIFENWRDAVLRAQKELELDPSDKDAREIVEKDKLRHEENNLYFLLSNLGFEKDTDPRGYGHVKVKRFKKDQFIVDFYLSDTFDTYRNKPRLDIESKFDEYFRGNFYDESLGIHIKVPVNELVFSKEFVRKFYNFFHEGRNIGSIIDIVSSVKWNLKDTINYISNIVPQIPKLIKTREDQLNQDMQSPYLDVNDEEEY